MCGNCAKECEPDARFCSGCGSSLVAPAAETTPAAEGSSEDSDVAQTLIAPSGLGAPEPPPQQVGGGRYRISRLLGEGANKRVYLARDTRLDRDVALAEIKTPQLDEDGRARLQRETQAMGQLGDHPGIVTVHDILDEHGRVFIVAQYMPGGDVAQHLDAHTERRLSPAEASTLALQVASALEHAHGRGVIHRDIKPGNIWLKADGTALLGDFGLAFAVDRTRLTQEGMMVGTASYMPPEQALGQLPDARSDLYALGATLYEMITGRPPFVGDDAVAVISQHINTRPVSPGLLASGVPKPLENLVLELLAKDPTKRPESAGAVRERLEQLQGYGIDADSSASTSAAGANPLDRLSSGVFVGREGEVERGRALFDESFAGQPRVLLLVGEPGIGKTRISEELTTYARMRGAQVYWGRCHEGEGAPPFWPWVQIVRSYAQEHDPEELRKDFGFGGPDIAGMVSEIRQVLPDLAEPPQVDPEQARFRLFDAMVSFLRNASQRAPIVLVLDDLHWADKPSLVLCEFLARELGPARLMVIATYRDVELRRQHPLTETLAELARLQLGERVLLRGISEQDVARFIEQSANLTPSQSLVAAIHRETEGNPFFVHEVVRLLTSDGRLSGSGSGSVESWSLEIPQGVREVVGRRLNRLSEECNELLLVGSVLGREFTLTALEKVTGSSGDDVLSALDEALAARVVSEVPGPIPAYRFSHALMRETLHEELSTPRRVGLHRKAAEALEEIHGTEGGAHLAEIAHHFFQAVQSGDLDRAVRALVRAAEWAGERQAFEEEAQHYERAIQVLEMESESDSEQLCELLVRLARAWALAADQDRARETALRAAELARKTGSAEHLARAALAYGEGFVVVEMGRVDATIVDLLDEALVELEAVADQPDSHLVAQVGGRLANELYFGGDIDRIESLLDKVEGIADAVDDPALRSQAIQARTFNLNVDKLDRQGLDLAERLQRHAREAGDIQLESAGRLYEFSFSLFRGNRQRLQDTLEAEEILATRSRMPLVRALPVWHRTTLAVLEGRWMEFRPMLSEAVRLMGGGVTNARQWGGMLLYVAGRALGMLTVTEETLGYVERFPDYPIYRAYLAACQIGAGEPDEARRHYDILTRDDFGARWRDYNRLITLALLADIAYGIDEREHADTLYAQLLPWSGRHAPGGAGVSYLGPFDQRLGMLASMQGDHETAVSHLQSAVEDTGKLGARPFQAESRLHLARALSHDGPQQDLRAARHQLEETLATARELTLTPLIEPAEALLATL